jgi:hypothetical protein
MHNEMRLLIAFLFVLFSGAAVGVTIIAGLRRKERRRFHRRRYDGIRPWYARL